MQMATMTARLRSRTPRHPASERRIHRAQPVSADVEVERHQSEGGPQDRAYYRCGCGLGFQAEVSSTVDCPRCGSAQAW
jgi:hypothetical protein